MTEQTIYFIIIIALLAVITIILCVTFIYALKILKKSSRIIQELKQRKKIISAIIEIAAGIIKNFKDIFKKRSKNNQKFS